MAVGRAAHFGAAGDAHAQAQAGDGDLVAFVHDRAARGIERFADVGADRIAVHRHQRQLQPERAQQGRRSESGAHHHGVEGAGRCLAGDGQGRLRVCRDAGHVGVELEDSTQPAGFVLQQQRKLPAVADFVVRQVNGAGKVGVRVQRGFDLARLVRADLAELHPRVAQHLQAGRVSSRSFSERSSTM
jgi:hypothetical protein